MNLTGSGLGLAAFARVTTGDAEVSLSADARDKIAAGRRAIERVVANGEPVYGVNTGFGLLSDRSIDLNDLSELQHRLLMSHAAGTGAPLARESVRGMLLLRANTLARGYSGVRPELVERLIEFLNLDLLAVVPSRGSVGASGDLAPLAHLALPVIGAGRVIFEGRETTAAEALAAAGLEPLRLEAKEGLALINGTQAMTALLAQAVNSAERLVRLADLVGALSTDAIRGTDDGFDARIHALRPHPGQIASAANLWSLLQGSEIRESHRTGDTRVQDPYSFRCMPQVHGAARDVLAGIAEKVEIEMNAVTDNPLVFARHDDSAEAEILSGGNFHGEPMAIGADCLAIAAAELGGISERRIEQLTDPKFSDLPAFLVEDSGLNSGFMIAHVTAAALASENKTLCAPASVDTIPTSAGKEDHVSMGMGACLKLARVLDNTRSILAIELLAACQGIDFRRPLRTSTVLEQVVAEVRETVAVWTEDRPMAEDIASAVSLVEAGLDRPLSQLS